MATAASLFARRVRSAGRLPTDRADGGLRVRTPPRACRHYLPHRRPATRRLLSQIREATTGDNDHYMGADPSPLLGRHFAGTPGADVLPQRPGALINAHR